MPATITIELKDLYFEATHGWYDEEAVTGTSFKVSVAATFDTTTAVITTLDKTINYAAVYAIVKDIFSQREKLLETVASKIAAAVHEAYPQVKLFEITITKFKAPISNFIGTVGITYSQAF